jgi:hypothetical protein
VRSEEEKGRRSRSKEGSFKKPGRFNILEVERCKHTDRVTRP